MLAEEWTDPTESFIIWPFNDHQGTVTAALAEGWFQGQDDLQYFKYDPFGAPKNDPSEPQSLANRLIALNQGRDYDNFTKLYYNRARWYDATTGRFISTDPIGFAAGDTNLYRAVGNSPANATDPSGLFAEGLLNFANDGENIYGFIPTDSFVGRGYDSAGNFLAAAGTHLADTWRRDPGAIIGETVHIGLDVVGLVPVVGIAADVVNAAFYAVQGRWVEAGFSAFAAIPGIGYLAVGGQIGKYTFKGSKLARTAITAVTHVDDVKKIATAARRLDIGINLVESGYYGAHGLATGNKVEVGLSVFGFAVNGAAVGKGLKRGISEGAPEVGRYGHLADPPTVGAGKNFTATQKAKIIQANRARNGGAVRSDASGNTLTKPQKSKKGVTPDPNEWQVDHVNPRDNGGTNSYRAPLKTTD